MVVNTLKGVFGGLSEGIVGVPAPERSASTSSAVGLVARGGVVDGLGLTDVLGVLEPEERSDTSVRAGDGTLFLSVSYGVP